MIKTKEKKHFKTTGNKGFHITFPNGITLSTQFGWGNYCENYDASKPFVIADVFEWERQNGREANTCEIAIFDNNGKWITREYQDKGDDVLGYVTFSQWLDIFDWCRNYQGGRHGSGNQGN